MGSLSIVHWIMFGSVAMLLLGGSRFSTMAGDVAKGIKEFKKGMTEDDDVDPEPVKLAAPLKTDRSIEGQADAVHETH